MQTNLPIVYANYFKLYYDVIKIQKKSYIFTYSDPILTDTPSAHWANTEKVYWHLEVLGYPYIIIVEIAVNPVMHKTAPTQNI